MSDSRAGGDIELLPILPLRNSVVFPASVVPINVGRPRSVRLVEDLVGLERAVVGIVSQRDAEIDEPRISRGSHSERSVIWQYILLLTCDVPAPRAGASGE